LEGNLFHFDASAVASVRGLFQMLVGNEMRFRFLVEDGVVLANCAESLSVSFRRGP
jgi:hypothetical protein